MLDTLEVKHGLVLPRRADELRALLPRYPLPLVSSPLPFQTGSSLNILEVQPQSEPRAGHWRCYFRARHNSWGLGAILGSDVDPVEVSDDSDMTFYAEDEYGEFTDDASYMDLDEARFLIVSELTRLVTSRGLDNISADQ